MRSAPALLLAVVLSILVACSNENPSPRPTPSIDAAAATAAFAEAYADFQTAFEAADALRDKDGLENAVRGVQAVRTAYADLADATRDIEMPIDVVPDVDAMLAAIDELVVTLDAQGEARSLEEFDSAAASSRDALQHADDTIQVVVDALGIDEPQSEDPSQGADGSYLDGGKVTDAEAWVRDLLDIGARSADHQTPAEDMGVVSAWRAAFPEVLGESNVVEYEQAAPENGVSGFAVLPEDGQSAASRSNPYYLAFAVRDASGRCAGGVLSGYPDPTRKRTVELTSGRPCTGAAVATAAGY